ncbi:MAG TPA: hypothetical protein VK973_09910 [Arenicellales bacterium]|nr:hypothetical protein [Arenicellales bacterium]
MSILTRISALLLLLGLPLASGRLAGLPQGFSDMPPRPGGIAIPEYSPGAYAVFTAGLVVVVLFLLWPRLFGFSGRGRSGLEAFDWAAAPRGRGRFPKRGRLGLALIGIFWPLAWWHPAWLGAAADHTFFPLWLGYALTVDGLTFARAGTSPFARSPARWLAWFPASAAAWWYFELLNRFIQNWQYLGVEDYSPLRYALGATLAFSTVLPAVLGTAALLSTFDPLRSRYTRPASARGREANRAVWRWLVAAGALGLAVMPWFPVALFALIWIAPLLILAGLLELSGRDTSLGHLLRGDWGPFVILGLAALTCGFFWEMWNYFAMPKWIYQVPWLNRFHLFEMPLVGYLGYLPFGPACWMAWLLLSPRRAAGA